MSETDHHIAEKKHELDEKKRELKNIIDETRAEEDKLHLASAEAGTKIEERLLKGYTKIRDNMRNGLAVVSIDRDACGGCFSIVPPQTLIELKQKIRLIHCENCGRLLVDESFFEEVREELNGLQLKTV